MPRNADAEGGVPLVAAHHRVAIPATMYVAVGMMSQHCGRAEGTCMAGSLDTHDLESKFRGKLLLPGDQDYDTARSVFRAMIDRRPGLIARCTCSRGCRAGCEVRA